MKKSYMLIVALALACLSYAQNQPEIKIEIKDENGKVIYTGPFVNQSSRSPNATNDAVGIGTQSPSPNAILDLTSTTKGLLLPRISDADMRAIVNPEEGLLVYNTTYHRMFYKSNDCWRSVGIAKAYLTFFPFPVPQVFVVPDCVSFMEFTLFGAKGRKSALGALGGNGALASGRMNVNGGDVFYVNPGDSLGLNGGINGGTNGGNGGGASDIRTSINDLNSRIIVAGGGGGGGADGCDAINAAGGVGGAGGGGAGANGGGSANGPGGFGGTVGVGGLAQNACGLLPATNGNSNGIGGEGSSVVCSSSNRLPGGGGGGGGYVVGGGGAGGAARNSSCSGSEKGGGGGGAGGSNYFAPFVAGASSAPGVNNGNGLVVIIYTLPN